MARQLDIGEVFALAPDDKRQAKAGRLAVASKWDVLGSADGVIWGMIRGGGQTPYTVAANLHTERITSQCSCPSREAPCKHALGLLRLWATAADAFTPGTRPDWVAVTQARPKPAQPKSVNAATYQRRQQEIMAGLNELDLWICDLVRAGLASVKGKPEAFYSNPAARLVDAKAPALAERVRALGGLVASGDAWAEQMLRELSHMHLIIEGFRRFDALAPPLQGDLRTAVGWYINKNELADAPPIHDTWRVVSNRQQQQDKLHLQRLWLYGLTSGQYALLVDFARATEHFDYAYRVGDTFTGEVVYYPSAYPLRAVVRQPSSPAPPPADLPGYRRVRASVDAYTAALAKNPWIGAFPVAYRGAIPIQTASGWAIVDDGGEALPLCETFPAGWELFGMSGGRPLWLFGEWDGHTLTPLTVTQGGKMISLG